MNESTEQNRNPAREGAPPLHRIYFYLTEGCNLACRHCWMAPRYDPEARGTAILPVETFEAVIREARPLGLTGVKLTGGEPLMHPRFPDLLRIVRREGLALNVETNGLLCTREIAGEIAAVPRRFASVSLDGADAGVHERIRGVPGCFQSALRAARLLAETGTPPQIIMSVMRANADQVEAMVRLAESLGASSVKFNIVQPTARGARLHGTEAALRVDELIALGRRIETELASGTRLTLFFHYPPAFRPLSPMSGFGECGLCGVREILGVLPSGSYALCGIGANVPALVFGVAGRDRLEEVWQENDTLRALRDGLPDRLGGICARCVMKRRCLGSCVAQNYYRSGRLWAPFWFCEEAERAGLFPDSRRITAA